MKGQGKSAHSGQGHLLPGDVAEESLPPGLAGEIRGELQIHAVAYEPTRPSYYGASLNREPVVVEVHWWGNRGPSYSSSGPEYARTYLSPAMSTDGGLRRHINEHGHLLAKPTRETCALWAVRAGGTGLARYLEDSKTVVLRVLRARDFAPLAEALVPLVPLIQPLKDAAAQMRVDPTKRRSEELGGSASVRPKGCNARLLVAVRALAHSAQAEPPPASRAGSAIPQDNYQHLQQYQQQRMLGTILVEVRLRTGEHSVLRRLPGIEEIVAPSKIQSGKPLPRDREQAMGHHEGRNVTIEPPTLPDSHDRGYGRGAGASAGAGAGTGTGTGAGAGAGAETGADDAAGAHAGVGSRADAWDDTGAGRASDGTWDGRRSGVAGVGVHRSSAPEALGESEQPTGPANSLDRRFTDRYNKARLLQLMQQRARQRYLELGEDEYKHLGADNKYQRGGNKDDPYMSSHGGDDQNVGSQGEGGPGNSTSVPAATPMTSHQEPSSLSDARGLDAILGGRPQPAARRGAALHASAGYPQSRELPAADGGATEAQCGRRTDPGAPGGRQGRAGSGTGQREHVPPELPAEVVARYINRDGHGGGGGGDNNGVRFIAGRSPQHSSEQLADRAEEAVLDSTVAGEAVRSGGQTNTDDLLHDVEQLLQETEQAALEIDKELESSRGPVYSGAGAAPSRRGSSRGGTVESKSAEEPMDDMWENGHDRETDGTLVQSRGLRSRDYARRHTVRPTSDWVAGSTSRHSHGYSPRGASTSSSSLGIDEVLGDAEAVIQEGFGSSELEALLGPASSKQEHPARGKSGSRSQHGGAGGAPPFARAIAAMGGNGSYSSGCDTGGHSVSSSGPAGRAPLQDYYGAGGPGAPGMSSSTHRDATRPLARDDVPGAAGYPLSWEDASRAAGPAVHVAASALRGEVGDSFDYLNSADGNGMILGQQKEPLDGGPDERVLAQLLREGKEDAALMEEYVRARQDGAHSAAMRRIAAAMRSKVEGTKAVRVSLPAMAIAPDRAVLAAYAAARARLAAIGASTGGEGVSLGLVGESAYFLRGMAKSLRSVAQVAISGRQAARGGGDTSGRGGRDRRHEGQVATGDDGAESVSGRVAQHASMPAAFSAALGDWVRSSRWWIDYDVSRKPVEGNYATPRPRSLPIGEVKACCMPAEELKDTHQSHLTRLATNAPAPGLGREQRDAARFRRAATGRNAAARSRVTGGRAGRSPVAGTGAGYPVGRDGSGNRQAVHGTRRAGGAGAQAAMERATADARLSEAALAADGVQRIAVRFGHRVDLRVQGMQGVESDGFGVSDAVEEWLEATLELRLFVEPGSSASSRLALVGSGQRSGGAGGGASQAHAHAAAGSSSGELTGADGRLLVCRASVPLRQLLLGDSSSWMACIDWVATEEATEWLYYQSDSANERARAGRGGAYDLRGAERQAHRRRQAALREAQVFARAASSRLPAGAVVGQLSTSVALLNAAGNVLSGSGKVLPLVHAGSGTEAALAPAQDAAAIGDRKARAASYALERLKRMVPARGLALAVPEGLQLRVHQAAMGSLSRPLGRGAPGSMGSSADPLVLWMRVLEIRDVSARPACIRARNRDTVLLPSRVPGQDEEERADSTDRVRVRDSIRWADRAVGLGNYSAGTEGTRPMASREAEHKVSPLHSAWSLAPRVVATAATVLPLPTGPTEQRQPVGLKEWPLHLRAVARLPDSGGETARRISQLPAFVAGPQGTAVLPLPADAAALEGLRAKSACIEVRGQVAGLDEPRTATHSGYSSEYLGSVSAQQCTLGIVTVPLRFVLFHAAKLQARKRHDRLAESSHGRGTAGATGLLGAESVVDAGIGGTASLHAGYAPVKDPVSGTRVAYCWLDVRIGASSDVLRCIGEQDAAYCIQMWARRMYASEASRQRVLPHLVYPAAVPLQSQGAAATAAQEITGTNPLDAPDDAAGAQQGDACDEGHPTAVDRSQDDVHEPDYESATAGGDSEKHRTIGHVQPPGDTNDDRDPVGADSHDAPAADMPAMVRAQNGEEQSREDQRGASDSLFHDNSVASAASLHEYEELCRHGLRIFLPRPAEVSMLRANSASVQKYRSTATAAVIAAAHREAIQRSAGSDGGRGVFIVYRFPLHPNEEAEQSSVELRAGLESITSPSAPGETPFLANDENVHVLWWSANDARNSTSATHRARTPTWFPFETMFLGDPDGAEAGFDPARYGGLQLEVWSAGERPIMPEGRWAFSPIEKIGAAVIDFHTMRSVVQAAVTPPREDDADESGGGNHSTAGLVAESSAAVETEFDCSESLGSGVPVDIVLEYRRRYFRHGPPPSAIQQNSSGHTEARDANPCNDAAAGTSAVDNQGQTGADRGKGAVGIDRSGIDITYESSLAGDSRGVRLKHPSAMSVGRGSDRAGAGPASAAARQRVTVDTTMQSNDAAERSESPVFEDESAKGISNDQEPGHSLAWVVPAVDAPSSVPAPTNGKAQESVSAYIYYQLTGGRAQEGDASEGNSADEYVDDAGKQDATAAHRTASAQVFTGELKAPQDDSAAQESEPDLAGGDHDSDGGGDDTCARAAAAAATAAGTSDVDPPLTEPAEVERPERPSKAGSVEWSGAERSGAARGPLVASEVESDASQARTARGPLVASKVEGGASQARTARGPLVASKVEGGASQARTESRQPPEGDRAQNAAPDEVRIDDYGGASDDSDVPSVVRYLCFQPSTDDAGDAKRAASASASQGRSVSINVIGADGRLLASARSLNDRPARASLRLDVGMLAALANATIETEVEQAGSSPFSSPRSSSSGAASGGRSATLRSAVPFGMLAGSNGRIRVDLTASQGHGDVGKGSSSGSYTFAPMSGMVWLDSQAQHGEELMDVHQDFRDKEEDEEEEEQARSPQRSASPDLGPFVQDADSRAYLDDDIHRMPPALHEPVAPGRDKDTHDANPAASNASRQSMQPGEGDNLDARGASHVPLSRGMRVPVAVNVTVTIDRANDLPIVRKTGAGAELEPSTFAVVCWPVGGEVVYATTPIVLASSKPAYGFRTQARVPAWALHGPPPSSIAGIDRRPDPAGAPDVPPGHATVAVYRRAVSPLRRWLMRLPADEDVDLTFYSGLQAGDATAHVPVAVSHGDLNAHDEDPATELPPGVQASDELVGTATVDLSRLARMGSVRGWYTLARPGMRPAGSDQLQGSNGYDAVGDRRIQAGDSVFGDWAAGEVLAGFSIDETSYHALKEYQEQHRVSHPGLAHVHRRAFQSQSENEDQQNSIGDDEAAGDVVRQGIRLTPDATNKDDVLGPNEYLDVDGEEEVNDSSGSMADVWAGLGDVERITSRMLGRLAAPAIEGDADAGSGKTYARPYNIEEARPGLTTHAHGPSAANDEYQGDDHQDEGVRDVVGDLALPTGSGGASPTHRGSLGQEPRRAPGFASQSQQAGSPVRTNDSGHSRPYIVTPSRHAGTQDPEESVNLSVSPVSEARLSLRSSVGFEAGAMVREGRSLVRPAVTAAHGDGDKTGIKAAYGSDWAGLSDSGRAGRDSAADFDELLRARSQPAQAAVAVEDDAPIAVSGPAIHNETSQNYSFDGLGGLGIGVAMGGSEWGGAGDDGSDCGD